MNDWREYLVHLGFSLLESPTPADIKKRWKDLCKEHHPDKGGDEAMFHKVTHAFKMLTDPSYRNQYTVDQLKRGAPNAGGDLNMRVILPVSFEDAFFSRAITISYNVFNFDTEGKLIPTADGDEIELDHLRIQLSPEIFRGFEAGIQGKGHRCGEHRGNVLIVLQVLPHPKFIIEGDQVVSVESVPLDVCLKGGTIEVITMYGMKKVKVRPGTQPGSTLKIPNAGLSTTGVFGQTAKGSHVVRVDIKFPSKDDLKEDTWKELGIDWTEDLSEDTEAAAYLRRFSSGTFTTTSTW